MQQPSRNVISRRDEVMEPGVRGVSLFFPTACARTPAISANASGCFPELLHLRLDALSARRLDAQDRRPDRASDGSDLGPVATDAADGDAGATSLRRGMVRSGL